MAERVVQGEHEGDVADQLREDVDTDTREELRAGLDEAGDRPELKAPLERLQDDEDPEVGQVARQMLARS